MPENISPLVGVVHGVDQGEVGLTVDGADLVADAEDIAALSPASRYELRDPGFLLRDDHPQVGTRPLDQLDERRPHVAGPELLVDGVAALAPVRVLAASLPVRARGGPIGRPRGRRQAPASAMPIPIGVERGRLPFAPAVEGPEAVGNVLPELHRDQSQLIVNYFLSRHFIFFNAR